MTRWNRDVGNLDLRLTKAVSIDLTRCLEGAPQFSLESIREKVVTESKDSVKGTIQAQGQATARPKRGASALPPAASEAISRIKSSFRDAEAAEDHLAAPRAESGGLGGGKSEIPFAAILPRLASRLYVLYSVFVTSLAAKFVSTL